MSYDESEKKTKDLISPYPNTYTWTKSLSENLIESEKEHLPICIVRPSIVTSSFKDPFPGWVDSMVGAAGLLYASGMGYLRVMHGSKHVLADFIPVDLLCNIILVAAFQNTVLPKTKTLKIFHATSGTRNPIHWNICKELVPCYFRIHKPKTSLFYPWSIFIKNRYLHYMMHILLHFFPALIHDFISIICWKKPIMVRNVSRLYSAISSLSYFTSHNWYFISKNAERLNTFLNETDTKLFNMDVGGIGWEQYIMNMCLGIQTFIIPKKNNPNQTEKKGILKRILSMILLFFMLILMKRKIISVQKFLLKFMFS